MEGVKKTADGKVGSSKQSTKEESSRISAASSRACHSIQRMDEEESHGREEFSDGHIRQKERAEDHSSGIESQEKRLFHELEHKFFTVSNSKIDSSQKTFEKSGAKLEELKSLQRTAAISKLDDQPFQATCDHHADQKKEETNTQAQCGDLNTRINHNHMYNRKATTPLHIHPANFEIVVREALMVSVNKHSNVDICTHVQNDGSTEMIFPEVAKVQFEAAAVKEMKKSTASCSSDDVETIKVYVEEQINYLSNSDGDTSFDSGYVGDDESTHDVNDNLKKVFRRRFGYYPDYRTRLNGVTWHTGYSSDDDDHRGSDRKCRKPSVGGVHENPQTTNVNVIPPYQGGDEDSEPVTIHVLPSKKIKKHRMNYKEVDTTCSEASDVESLTDCSLCLSDGRA